MKAVLRGHIITYEVAEKKKKKIRTRLAEIELTNLETTKET